MDHHCPWINNCVGHDNYSHFLRFIFYVDLTCGYAMVLFLWRAKAMIDPNSSVPDPSVTETMFLIVDFILTFIVLFCVGILSMYHLYCLATNQTAIEGSERSKVQKLIRQGKIAPVVYPFHIGFYKNVCSVLGDNPLLWMWPQRMPGNGVTFPIRPGTDPKLPYYWPPRDPNDLHPTVYSETPQLIRRDSEGYLVREITAEDRIRMLQEYETADTDQHAEEPYYEDEYYPMDSDHYFYDSGSCEEYDVDEIDYELEDHDVIEPERANDRLYDQ
ncbi:Palmitoyltransferase [Apophysomyces sp. BC1034]|nr:Palmitoyltransferase [Apophysomyces sp. BC1021]KAG0184603.1 Palmitoyltransferase [Apophysomyces sp. BC1034]